MDLPADLDPEVLKHLKTMFPSAFEPEAIKRLKALSEADARQLLTEVTTPQLEKARALIPQLPTSVLIGTMIDPNEVLDLLEVSEAALLDEQIQLIVAAAMMAVTVEIDRRIPPAMR